MSKRFLRIICRSIASARFKIAAMFGTAIVMLGVYMALLLCFLTVRGVITAPRASSIGVACVDSCNSVLSQKLVFELSNEEGFVLFLCDSYSQAEKLLIDGRAEALLTIHSEYDEMLISDESSDSSLFTLTIAPSSASAELIREEVAGKMLSQRAYERVVAELVRDGYTDAERQLENHLEVFDSNAPKLYTVSTVGGGNASQRPLFGRLFAGYSGFAALCLLLLGLTLSRWMTRPDSRNVASRMETAEDGCIIAFMGDFFALLLVNACAAAIAAVIAPYANTQFILGLFAYAICLTGLALLISRFGGMGKIDVAAPFIALSTSIIGGCFVDISSVSRIMRVISFITPQGQLIAATNGAWVFSLLLLVEGVFLTVIANILSRQQRLRR